MAVGDPCEAGDMAWILFVEGDYNKHLIGMLVEVVEDGKVDPTFMCCDRHRTLMAFSWKVKFPRPVEVCGPLLGIKRTVEYQILPDAWLKPQRNSLLDGELTDTGTNTTKKEGAPA